MNRAEKYVSEALLSLKDEEYGDFQARLMPNIEREKIIGVRTPELRKFAKEFAKTDMAEEFLRSLPHRTYDENNLHGAIIAQMKDYARVIRELDRFLPYVDNWATCDMLSPKILASHKTELLSEIRRWISSGETYTVRFAIEMLMSFYLDGDFSPEYLELVSSVRSDEYYVKMIVAWYFATALAKQYDSAVVYIETNRLDEWTHAKAIQKSRESRRLSDERKEYLRSLLPKKK